MSFSYKNPKVGTTLSSPDVVTRLSVVGTNFSVLSSGGYMEVWSLDDLNFQTFGGSGTIQNSGNTIPINYQKSTLGFIPSKVTIEDDGITSGRRRLGMLVYVHETDQVYQYVIPNYENLFNSASGATEEESSTGKYIVSDNTTEGLALVDAWLDSSVEGVSGVTKNNARWRIFWGTDWQVTGGTVDYNSTGDLNINSNSGNTITISGLTTITGGTYLSATTTLELYNNLGDTISVTGFNGGGGGTSGSSGSSGTSGSSGSSGSSGTSGSSGSSGTSGSSGSSGTSGSSGSSGTSGSSGSSGTSGTLDLTGNTIDGVITYNGVGGNVESNLLFNGDNDTLTISGDSYTYGNDYKKSADTEITTNGNHTIVTIPVSTISGSSLHYNYYVEEQSTGGFRTGKIMAAVNRSADTTVYTDNSTVDGTATTNDIVFSTVISGNNLILRATTTNNTTWYVKVGTEIIF